MAELDYNPLLSNLLGASEEAQEVFYACDEDLDVATSERVTNYLNKVTDVYFPVGEGHGRNSEWSDSGDKQDGYEEEGGKDGGGESNDDDEGEDKQDEDKSEKVRSYLSSSFPNAR